MRRRILIVGGPSSGKTTIIDQLAAKGYHVFREYSRELIQKSLEEGSDVLPWKDVEAFNREIYSGRKQQWFDAQEGINFYDRDLHDGKAYLLVNNIPIPRKLDKKHKQFTYSNPVFFLPFWEEIYETDDQRKETPEQAEKLGSCIRQVYADLGYEIIDIKKMAISERLTFILKHLSSYPN